MAGDGEDDGFGDLAGTFLRTETKSTRRHKARPAADGAAGDEPHYHGHRERLRARFLSGGNAALQDYEVLELILFRAIPRRDVKPLAKALIARFGTLGDVLSADIPRLLEVSGLGEAAAGEIKIVQAAALRLMQGGVLKRPVLSSWTQLVDYCRAAMSFEGKEQFRILFLDRKNALIADEVQQEGTIDHTPVYPREVVKRALELGASSVILVHNHPSGDPTPSSADIKMTREIVGAAKTLAIAVHDHLIIGRGKHVSLRSLGLM